jgi:hypothetical protein
VRRFNPGNSEIGLSPGRFFAAGLHGAYPPPLSRTSAAISGAYAALHTAQYVPGNKHQVAHQQDHKSAMDMRNRDMSKVNDYGDQRDHDGDNEGDNLGC